MGVWIETQINDEPLDVQKSLLMWECGLKQFGTDVIEGDGIVTPYVGVWIETLCQSNVSMQPIVTPYVGVWIETIQRPKQIVYIQVTPYVGVWIETLQVGHAKRLHCVTPYVGVWIETSG